MAKVEQMRQDPQVGHSAVLGQASRHQAHYHYGGVET